MAITNITIDDTNGDPTTGTQILYSPAGFWKLGPTCGNCTAQPDPTKAYEQTWRDTSYIPADDLDPLVSLSAEVSFNGTAVYVYGIIILGITELATTDLQFLIDGQHAGNYSAENINGTGYQYNTLYFSKQGLSPINHTLTILNGANMGPQISLILLDKIVYTQSEVISSSPAPPVIGPTSSSSTSSSSVYPFSSTTSNVNTTTPNVNTTTPTVWPTLPTTSPPDSTSNPSGSPSPFDSSTPSTSAGNGSHSHTIVITGSVLGVIAGLVLLASLFFYCKRHRSNKGLRPRWGTAFPTGPTPLVTDRGVLPLSSSASLAQPTEVPSPPLIPQAIASEVSDPRSRESTYGGSEKGPEQDLPPSVRTRMQNTAMLLAVEVQRLREENGRLQPPPYL